MRKIVLFGAAAAALVSSAALAQQAPDRFDRSAGVTRDQVESRVRNLFARVDADRDGFVTQAEAGALRRDVRAQRRERRGDRREAVFERLDANRDGMISRAEFLDRPERAERGERRGFRAERRAERMERRSERRGLRSRGFAGPNVFAHLDSNRDGRISLAEATEARLRAFERADLNRDGRVTRDERRSLRQDRGGRRG